MQQDSRTIGLEELGGQGETLVLVHGLGGSTNTWFPQAQVLKRDFRIVAYDLAGSARSRAAGDISMARHVEDLLAVVHDTGSPRVHLAGHSMGTIVCQYFAAEHPELVASLALLGAFPEPPEAARNALRERAAKARAEGMRGIADAIVAGGTSDDTKTNQPAVLAFVRESLMAQPPEGYAANCEALAGAKAADLSRIACPTLVLNGDQDRTAPPDVGRAIVSAVRGAEFVLLPGCGHWPTVERAKQVNYALSLFYARLRKPQQAPGEGDAPAQPEAVPVPGFQP
ncbi:alpha/beta fold hydrolase [Arenibaculum pallidiluteum]|uniref:alpha/beta fold hydrolase n=1 Tax=Arenibaculum pallidiluteum TaxID=2812559 RepID=UPI001A966407|nr:alpha/beta fold hydrolase [Arenibaculum pallidiluteum]